MPNLRATVLFGRIENRVLVIYGRTHNLNQMQINPYNPPNANLQNEPTGAVRRPISVWLLQIILVVVALVFLLGALRSILAGDVPQFAKQNPIGLVIGIAWRVVFLFAVVAMIYCIHRGLRFARWICLMAIAALAAFGLLGSDTTHYANEAQRAGGFVGRYFVAPLLFIWWAYAIAFSRKAQRYFAKRDLKVEA
jgi:ABC-type Na+ efflux pump permease subunit